MIRLNTFYNEDCSETMSKMEDNLIDCILTSPPYNMTKRKGGSQYLGTCVGCYWYDVMEFKSKLKKEQ